MCDTQVADEQSESGKRVLMASMARRISTLEDALFIQSDGSQTSLVPGGNPPLPLGHSRGRTRDEVDDRNDPLAVERSLPFVDDDGQSYFDAFSSTSSVSKVPDSLE